jgi:hypothetical protein
MVNKWMIILVLCFGWSGITRAQPQQNDFAGELQRKLTLYYNNNMPAHLQLFFNQPAYSAGDTAWFNISFLAARELRPIADRQIIQVYITDRQGTPLLHQQVVTGNGFGANQIVIPESFSAGVYTVVAFSEGMKNHDVSFFFYADLVISGSKQFVRRGSPAVALFPEGGNFVSGVTNRVAVSAGAGARISIRDAQGKEVAVCVADSQGWGSFYLNPRDHERYTAVAGSTSVALPVPVADRADMLLTAPVGQESMRMVVQAGEAYRQENNLYLVISAQDHVYYSVEMNFQAKKAAIVNVPYAVLPHGLAQATLFRADGSVEAERLFFVKAATARVDCKPDKAVYGTREPVTLQLHCTAPDGQPLVSQLGIRVISADLFQDEASADEDTRSVMADLPYGTAGIAPALKAGTATFDNLLIAQSWKRFSWGDVWNEAVKNEYRYRNYLYLTGRLKHDRPLPDSTLVTFFLQQDAQAYFGSPDKEGRIDFPIFREFQNTDEVLYRVEHQGKKISNVSLELAKADERFQFNLPTFQAMDITDGYYHFSSIVKRINAAYALQSRSGAPEKLATEAWTDKEIFRADHTIRFSDFVLFPTMGETLREIVPNTIYRSSSKHEGVRVVIIGAKLIPSEDPTYIIDGVMTDNTAYFLSLKPEHVSTVRVICAPEKLHAFGALGKNGVLLVETNLPGNAARVPRGNMSFSVTGLNPVLPFSTLHTDEQMKRIPLLKSTVYWNPKVVTDQNGNAVVSFHTPDNTGNFKIQISGVTASGELVFSEARFAVDFDQHARH